MTPYQFEENYYQEKAAKEWDDMREALKTPQNICTCGVNREKPCPEHPHRTPKWWAQTEGEK
jgi:hypothetical protein